MATATAILNEKYASKDGTFPIVIRLIDGKKQKLHPVKYKIDKKYWKNGQVIDSHPEAEIINSIIDEEVLAAKRYFRDCRLQNIPIDLELVFKAVKSHSFTEYLTHRAAQHKAADELEMQLKVQRLSKELAECFSRGLYFSEITQDLLRKYDAWLIKRGNVANTRHKKFSDLSKYYSHAINEGKAQSPNPFLSYIIKTTPVKKEKLTKEQIHSIETAVFENHHHQLSRDIFLFSYYCKGLRFENCISMPKSAIVNGRLHYKINKGLKYLSSVIHPKLQEIIDRYIDNETDTIFGRFSLSDIDTKLKKRRMIGSENAYINKGLKEVAKTCKIPVALSSHHSRHSFAFNLKKMSNNIHVIKDALGHSKTSTTEIYLQSLDDEFLDDAVKGLYE